MDRMEKSLLYKYIKGDATSQEKKIILEWLDASPENMNEFLTLRKLYDYTIWHEDTTFVEYPDRSESHKWGKIPRWGIELLKIAAIFILMYSGIKYFMYKEKPDIKMQTVIVPSGQRVQLLLADGTKVWLNSQTTFIFPNFFDEKERKVFLDGEAYFDVQHESGKTFTVNTEYYDVRVLGTKFNLRAYKSSEAFETALFDGSVEIIGHNRSTKVLLHPDNRAFRDNGVLKMASIEDYDHFLWKEGIIYFDNETVTEILKKLEFYFDTRIYIENTQLANYRYSGKFRTKDGVEQVLKVLQLKHRFTFEKDEETNTITIK